MFSIAFREYPKQVNLAILSLCLAWLFHYFFYFSYLFDREAGMANVDYLQLGVGVGICLIVAGIKRWARMMSLFFNLGMLGMYLFLAYGLYGGGKKMEAAVLAATVAVMFALATYFLLNREVDRFFKQRDPVPESPEPEAPASGRPPEGPSRGAVKQKQKKRIKKN